MDGISRSHAWRGDALFFHSRAQRLNAIDHAVFQDKKVARMTFRTQEDMQALKKQVQQQEQARVQYRREWDRHSCLSSETSPPNTRTGRSACPTKTRTRSWYPSASQEISYHEVGAHHSGRDCAVVYAVAGW
jgi:hypothetical protein